MVLKPIDSSGNLAYPQKTSKSSGVKLSESKICQVSLPGVNGLKTFKNSD